jgi:hypothetical protein
MMIRGNAATRAAIHTFIHSFHIPLIFTDVELVIFIINIVYKQVNIVIPFTNYKKPTNALRRLVLF